MGLVELDARSGHRPVYLCTANQAYEKKFRGAVTHSKDVTYSRLDLPLWTGLLGGELRVKGGNSGTLSNFVDS